jgi:hypothetical protein
MKDNGSEKQKEICERFHVSPVPVAPNSKVGIAKNVKSGLLPINGMRCIPMEGTSGWFIWAGEHLSSDPDFFQPLHASHLETWCPTVIPYLQLAPGWRFLLAPQYEDVWFDTELLVQNDGVPSESQ